MFHQGVKFFFIMYKKKYIHILVIFLCFLLSFKTNSVLAQETILYNMVRVPQSGHLNLGHLPNCGCFSGIAAPLIGVLPPAMQIELRNSGFTYNDAFYLKKTEKGDTLYMRLADVEKKLRKTNILSFRAQAHLLSFAIRRPDYYLSFNLTNKTDFRFVFPKMLLSAALHGNWDETKKAPRDIDLSGLNVNLTNYNEFATSFTKGLKNLNIGGSVKLLFGGFNLSTQKSDLTLHTAPDAFNLSLSSDAIFASSLPVNVIADKDNYVDSVSFDDFFKQPLDDFLFTKNFGLALDFGAQYRINSQLLVSANIIDVGFIRWKQNTRQYISKHSYKIEGIDFSPGNEIVDFDEYIDSVFNDLEDNMEKFIFRLSDAPYATTLPIKIYLNGNYRLSPKTSCSLLLRGELFKKKLLPSFTVAFNTQPTRWLSMSLTYSSINYTFDNFGAGIAFTGRNFQLFAIADNIPAIINPKNYHGTGIRFGMNMLFGCFNIPEKEEEEEDQLNDQLPLAKNDSTLNAGEPADSTDITKADSLLEDHKPPENEIVDKKSDSEQPDRKLTAEENQKLEYYNTICPPGVNGRVIRYEVQILSVQEREPLDSKYFKGAKDIKEGWYRGAFKYSVGNSSTYKEINALKNKLKQKFSDAFVIAFCNGKRIAVKDAVALEKINR